MGDKFVITKIEFNEKPFTFAGYYKDGVLCKVSARPDPCREIIGNIYLGKVAEVQKNIGGAFVDIGGEKVYVFSKNLKPQQEIVVQIRTDARGNKLPYASEKLQLAGRYAVVCEGESGLSFSSKLTYDQKQQISGWEELSNAEDLYTERIINPSRYKIIIRTNAAYADKRNVLAEITELCSKIETIRNKAATSTCFSMLYEEAPFYIKLLNEIPGVQERIITDDKEIYEKLSSSHFFKTSDKKTYNKDNYANGKASDKGDGIEFYNDNYPLSALCNIDRDLKRLMCDKVYLKSGAYLVIEKTEAFISIDVNSGKFEKGKIPEETYRKINCEAAIEAARQIELRNLSGMILIDFINLKEQEHRDELLNVMRKVLKRDSGRAKAVDITPLGIMEITRSRREKSLDELI